MKRMQRMKTIFEKKNKKINNKSKNLTGSLAMLKHHKKIAVFLLTLFLGVSLLGCSTTSQQKFSVSGPKVYLLNKESKVIEPINLDLKEVLDPSNANEVIEYVILLLRKGVSSSTLAPTIPEDVLLRYYTIDDKNVNINFSGAYLDLPFDEEIYLRSSVIRSLTSFEMFMSVEIFVNGVPLKLDEAPSLGRQYASDILVSYDESMSREEKQIVTIYFPSEDLSRLIPVFTTITITPNMKLEEIIVEELLLSKNRILPADVELLNVYTHEGICFVDFSKEFQTSFLPSGISERIAIYSLVNSLTELTNITNVQILVEGEMADTFQGNLSLNRIFTKNYSLIETDFGGD